MRAVHVSIQFLLALGSVLIVGAASIDARGQDRDSVYTIGEITVTATRQPTAAASAPQRVDVITREDVQSSGARHLADLLEARSGLFVRRYGEGLSTVTLRGASPSQTALLIDGLRLSDPQLGQFDLSLLPTHLIESVEVVHGPTSALYGADGLAGAINLRQLRPDSNHLALATEAGAYGERRMSAGASLGSPNLSAELWAEYSTAEGDFPYLNESLFPPRVVRRQNADRRKQSLFGTLELKQGAHRTQLALLYAQADRGLPGGAGGAPIGERQWDEHFRLWAQDEIRRGSSEWTFSGFLHRGALRYANPQLELDETGRILSAGAEAVLRRDLGPTGILIAGSSAGYAAAEHPSLSESARELHGAGFLSGSYRMAGLLIYPALRVDAYLPAGGSEHEADEHTKVAGSGRPPTGGAGVSGFPSANPRLALSPRLGLNAGLTPSLRLKANAGMAFRMPTFNDRFWQPGGNRNLQPERARSVELGLALERGDVRAELTAYRSRTVDQIVWSPGTDGIWSPENLSETVSSGLETSANWTATAHVSGGLIYTFTDAVDRSDPSTRTYGRQLRYRPRHQMKAHLDAVVGPLNVSVHARYIGRRFVTSDETESLSPVFVLDTQAGVSRPLGPFRARLSLVVENVLDARYALIQNYPMPPRHARVRLLLDTRSN